MSCKNSGEEYRKDSELLTHAKATELLTCALERTAEREPPVWLRAFCNLYMLLLCCFVFTICIAYGLFGVWLLPPAQLVVLTGGLLLAIVIFAYIASVVHRVRVKMKYRK